MERAYRCNPSSWLQPLESILWINTDGMPINGAIWYLTATLSLFLIATMLIVGYHNGHIGMRTEVIMEIMVLFF